jgi:hypothetical protein
MISFIVTTLLTVGGTADLPFADLRLDAARAVAKEQEKLLLIDFFITCESCKKLDETTWADERVRSWLREKVIALRIDAGKEPALARRLHVEACPTILLLAADGTEIDRLVGYRAPDQFLGEAASALAAAETERLRELIDKVTAATPHVDGNPLRTEIETTMSMDGFSITESESVLLDGYGSRRQEMALSTSFGTIEVKAIADGIDAWIERRSGPKGGPIESSHYHGSPDDLDAALAKLGGGVLSLTPLDDIVRQLVQLQDHLELARVEERVVDGARLLVLTAYRSAEDREGDQGQKSCDRWRYLIEPTTFRVAGLESSLAGGGDVTTRFRYRRVDLDPTIAAIEFAFRPPQGAAVTEFSEIADD